MLVCDDDSMILRGLEFQFKKDGFEILKAVNGREAREILTENSDIDVFLTDIHMPLMNGLELVTYVRKTLQRDIPIIVVSRVNVEDTILHAFELGANEYLTKPFNLEDLSNRVKYLLKND
jgi:DNA-binding response OmpR family regulator